MKSNVGTGVVEPRLSNINLKNKHKLNKYTGDPYRWFTQCNKTLSTTSTTVDLTDTV